MEKLLEQPEVYISELNERFFFVCLFFWVLESMEGSIGLFDANDNGQSVSTGQPN